MTGLVGALIYVQKARISPDAAFETLTTHIFDPDDPYIDSDAVFGVKKSLLAKFVRVDDPARAKQLDFDNRFWEVKFDFVLASAPDRS